MSASLRSPTSSAPRHVVIPVNAGGPNTSSATDFYSQDDDSDTSLLRYIQSRLVKERILFINNQHWKTIVGGACFQYVHSVSTNIAYLLHVQREPLFDLGFALLPALTPEVQIVSEIMFFLFLGSMVVWSLRPFWDRSYSHLYFTLISSRFLGVCMIAQSLRLISFLATSLPGPNYHCRPGSIEYAPPKNMQDIFFRQDAFFGCGDLVFSSHTIFVTLLGLTYQRYGDSKYVWRKRIMWVFVFLFGLVVIAARKHYTLDIVAAWYTVILLWIVYEHFLPLSTEGLTDRGKH